MKFASPKLMHAQRADRTLYEYEKKLGPEFTRALYSLTTDQHWVDMGAGHAVAVFTAITGKDLNGNNVFQKGVDHWFYLPFFERHIVPAKVTAIGFRPPQKNRNHEAFFPEDRFQYIEEAVENLDVGTIEPADLITDLCSPLSYSAHIDIVLTKYFSLLKPGGKIIAYLANAGARFKTATGHMRLSQWLASLGITHSIVRRPNDDEIESYDGSDTIAISITKPLKPYVIPAIKLVELHVGAPPIRLYQSQ